MIRLEGGAGFIGKVIRSRRLKALALKISGYGFLPHPTAVFRFNTRRGRVVALRLFGQMTNSRSSEGC